MTGRPTLKGPLKMGVYKQAGPLTNVSATLLGLHPDALPAFVLGAYTHSSGDAVQYRSLDNPDPLFDMIGALNETRWITHPPCTTEVVSGNRSANYALDVRFPSIASGSYVCTVFTHESDMLTTFDAFHPVHYHTYFATDADDDLNARLGDNAYICALSIGAGSGDDVELKLDATTIFEKNSTANSTVYLPYPIPTNLIKHGNPQTITPLLANVTVGSGGYVTVAYFQL